MGVRINVYTVELVRESAKVYDLEKAVTSPGRAVEIVDTVLGLSTKTKEHLVMASLNTKNEIVGLHTIHIGSVNASIVHPREVFQQAVLNNATSIMVFHNHPSGDPSHSQEDVKVTRRLVEAGKIMGIELLDHIVIGDGSYTSLKEKGFV